MNSLILSALIVVVALFHLAMKSFMRRGKIKAGFCAVWCMNAIFAVCGTVLSFLLYRYLFYPYLTVRNVVWVFLYLLVTILFIGVAPTGFSLVKKKRNFSEEEILMAEYRLNDTLEMVRNFFLLLLFLLPILCAGAEKVRWLSLLFSWREEEICGGFCFVAFLILVPVCLRQSLFWLRNLTDTTMEAEERVLRKYQMQLQYRHRNRIL